MNKLKRLLAFGGVSAIMLGGVFSNIIPASFRLAAPFLCPSETKEAVVLHYSYSSGKQRHAVSKLMCIDTNGSGTPIGGLSLYLTLIGMALPLAFVGSFFYLRDKA